jgi:hypothetical protein
MTRTFREHYKFVRSSSPGPFFAVKSNPMKSRIAIAWVLALLGLDFASAQDWQPLFDGKSLNGWKASEGPGSFKVVDGLLACDGPRSHLFYVGPDGQADFKNFEFSAEVMTKNGANSGVYFHT